MTPVDSTWVPGAAGRGAFWEPVARRLPAEWSKRTIDWPGLGPAPASSVEGDDAEAHPDEHAVQSYDDFARHVARAIPTPTLLVGQSMGAYVSLKVALARPDLVRRMVLVAATAGIDVVRHGARDWRIGARDEEPAPPDWVLAPPDDLTAQLHRIQVPVLLVWAARDPLSPLGVARELAARLPRSSLVVLDSDDHWAARERPDETAAVIREWARALEG